MKKKSSRRKKGARPRRGGARLGQHFLTGLWAARALAGAIHPARDEEILEIGPGKGALTRELLKIGPVVAVEKDEALVEMLQKTFAKEIAAKRLRLVREDVRNISPEKLGLKHYVVAANIPYYITGEIIRQFLTAKMQPRAMALLVQKEVAQRIVGNPEPHRGAAGAKESILSLSVKAYGVPKIVAKVTRGNFSPPPAVDSAILLIEKISRVHFGEVSEEKFFAVVHAGFSSKRKLLASNLARHYAKEFIDPALMSAGLSATVRAEDIPIEKWLHIAAILQ